MTYFEFGKRETSSSANSAVVFDGGTPDYWAKLVDRTRGYGCRFGNTGIATARLAARLLNTEKYYQLSNIE